MNKLLSNIKNVRITQAGFIKFTKKTFISFLMLPLLVIGLFLFFNMHDVSQENDFTRSILGNTLTHKGDGFNVELDQNEKTLVSVVQNKDAKLTATLLSKETIGDKNQASLLKKFTTVPIAAYAYGQNTDIEYEITNGDPQSQGSAITGGQGLKETIILKDKSSPRTFTFFLNLENIKSYKEVNGSWHFLDSSGETLFLIPKGFMVDDKGNRSDGVLIQIKKDAANQDVLTVAADSDWLDDPQRSYPVKIDPSIIVSGGIVEAETQFGGLQRKLVFANNAWYAFYNDGADVFYKKSQNGSLWKAPVDLDTSDADNYNPTTWLEGQYIYTAWIDDSADAVEVNRIDTQSSDSLGTKCTSADQGTIDTTSFTTSIAVADDGTVYVAYSDTSSDTENGILKLTFSGCSFTSIGATTVYLTTADTSPWTVPSDWTNTNTIRTIGGGGAGDNLATGGGGGGGGAYAAITNTTALTAGGSAGFSVGTGGTDAVNGGNTWFCNNTTSCAHFVDTNVIVSSDGGVTSVGAAGGAGGGTAGIGTASFDGGAGGSGNATGDDSTGGGGGAGSPSGTGGTGGAGDSAVGGDEAMGGGGGSGCDSIGAVNDGVAGGANGGAGGDSCFATGGAGGTTANGSPGTNGSGGGGGDTAFSGGAGGAGVAGSDVSRAGGGGGGGDDDGGTGGNGGLYGGGGGGGATVGNGAAGNIAITYNSADLTSGDRPVLVTIGNNLHVIFQDGNLSHSIYNGSSWTTSNTTIEAVTDNVYDVVTDNTNIWVLSVSGTTATNFNKYTGTWATQTDPWTSQTNVTSVSLTYDSTNSDIVAHIIKDTSEQAYTKTTDATTTSWGSEYSYAFTAGDLGHISSPMTAAGTSQIGVVLRQGSNFEFAPSPPIPRVYWKFDEGTGTTAYDSTTNANNGTLSGVISFDAASSANTNPDSTTLAWSHTTGSCANRTMVVSVGDRSNTAVSTITYGSQSLTKIRNDNPGTDVRSELWYLTNPSSGAATITVTVGTSTTITAGATTWCSTDQSASPFSNNNGSSGTGTTASVAVTSAIPELVIDAVTTQNAVATLTVAASQTQRFNRTGTANNTASSSKPGATSATMSWTLPSETWAISAASLKPYNLPWQTEDQCIFSKCLYFDGTNNVSRADDASLDFGATNSFTVEAWVKRNGASTAINYIISKADTTTGGYKLWMDADGDLCFGIDDDATWGPDISACSDTNGDFDDSKWHHVAGVRSVASDAVLVYVDGVQKDSQADPTTATLENTNIFYVGVDRDGTSNEWLGFIDEVKVFAGARTAAQIRSDYNARGVLSSSVNFGNLKENNPPALANGLVGYWTLQETATPSLDSSGNSNSGTWTGTTSTTGKFGNGNDFSGTDQYIQVADSASLDVTSVTLAAWVNADTLGTTARTIIQKSTSAGTDGYSMDIDTSSKIRYCGSGGCASSTTSLSTASWTHIAVTVDSSGTRFYLNGALDGTSTANTSVPTNALVLRMGVDSTSASDYDGKIDEARVYNRALSGADVTSLYNFAPGPVGYWKFDEKTGTAAEDSSSLGNQATLTNTPTWTQGKYGAGINFPGSNAHVTRADDSDFDFGTAASFTYGAWVKHASTPATVERIITKYDAIVGNGGFALQIETDGDFTCGIDDDEATFPEDSAVSTAATYDDNLWHYVSCVKDGTTGLYLYIDGVLIASDTTISSTGDFANADPLYIGIAEDGISNDFIGQIDEPKIYNYARTAGQIVEDMNAGHPAPGSPVGSAIGYWKFDEGVDNTCSGGTNDACNSGNAGNGIDAAGSGFASPATAASGWSNSGKFQKALQFDGTDDVVTVTNATAIDLNDNLAATHTFTAWVYAETAGEGSGGQVYWKGATTFLRVDTLSGGRLDVEAQLDLATTDATVNVSSAIATNSWNHIAVTYTDDGDDEIDVYINGNLRGSSTNGNGAPAADTNNLLIGGTTTDNFDGRIDEFKVYNSALTAGQVLQDMNRGSQNILGALSDNSSYEKNAANQEYCVPGDSTSCASPTGEYKFDEKQGQTLFDTSGNGNNGTLGSTSSVEATDATWDSGKLGAAVKSNGTSTFSRIPDSNNIDFAFDQNFTVSFWVKYINAVDNTCVVEKWDGSGGYPYVFRVHSSNMKFFRYDGTNNPTINGNISLGNNVWHYVTGVKSGSTLTLYIDGRQDVTGTDTTTGTTTNTSDLYIGERGGGLCFFSGVVDQLRIYNYARTAAQIAWDYNRGGPVGWWKFDECSGTTLNDASVTNTNNGTWSGTAAGSNTASGSCSEVNTAAAWYNGRTGKLNSSLDFDGTDDVVTVTNATAVDFDTGLAKGVSFAAWIYANSDGEADVGRFFEKRTGTYCRTDTEAGGLDLECQLDLATTDPNVNIADAFAINTWNHVVITYDDDADDDMVVYINGVSRGTGDGSGAPAATDTSDLLIGGPTGANFDGQIDDVRIYNYGLTATQVKTVMNDGAVRFGPVTGSP